ncbi:MAG: hypothetical protein QM715_17820 [Nibricoccus sp.]
MVRHVDFALIFLALLTCGISRAASDTATATEAAPETIVLPKYDVTTDRVLAPIEKWDYVAIDGFEILSNAPNKETRRFVKDFCLLQQVAKILLPGAKTVSPAPTSIVLCEKEKAFAAFLPQEDAKSSAPVRGRFLSNGERDAIVVDFGSGDNPGLADTFDFSWDSAFRSFYLQYFRQIIRRSIKPAPPYWLEEGLVQLFANTDFSDTHINFADLDRHDTSVRTANQSDSMLSSSAPRISESMIPERELPRDARQFASSGDFRSIFSQRGFIPLKEFFAVSGNTPVEKRPEYFSTQAFLFTHLCLYGQEQRYASAFFKLAEESARGPITEEIFKKHFGMSYSTMQIEMRSYIEFTNYKSLQMSSGKSKTKLAEVPPFTVRPATDAESSRISGEVLRLAGHKHAALNRLIAAYVRGNYDADLLAVLGCAELDAGHAERARKFLETAFRDKTTQTQAYLELAKLRVSEINAKLSKEGRMATQDEIAYMQAPLYAGLKQPAAGAAFHSLIARTWLISPTVPTKEQYGQLLLAAQKYYHDLGLVYYVAELGRKIGYPDMSRQLAVFGMNNAADAKAKARFEALLRELPSEKQAAGPKP